MQQIPRSLLCLLLIFVELISAKSSCPNPHDIHPCYCLASKAVIVCEDIDYEEDLIRVMKAAKNRKVAGVELQSVWLTHIPKKAFVGTSIKFLEISNSSIRSLTDGNHAFEGLEKSLTSLRVTNCTYASDWDWTQLEKLKKLQVLEISNSHLTEITEEFLKLSKLPLVNINFRDNNIVQVPHKAFATFNDLDRLNLDTNSLQSVTRSMLPFPAKKLYSLSFSHNMITELPTDMFSGMPSLKYLYLGGNPIHVLEAPTFEPIWNQLNVIFLHDAPLRCDCQISWITKMKQKLRFAHGTCSSPVKFRGRKITELMEDDFLC